MDFDSGTKAVVDTASRKSSSNFRRLIVIASVFEGMNQEDRKQWSFVTMAALASKVCGCDVCTVRTSMTTRTKQ